MKEQGLGVPPTSVAAFATSWSFLNGCFSENNGELKGKNYKVKSSLISTFVLVTPVLMEEKSHFVHGARGRVKLLSISFFRKFPLADRQDYLKY